jgi:hypothetical protein
MHDSCVLLLLVRMAERSLQTMSESHSFSCRSIITRGSHSIWHSKIDKTVSSGRPGGAAGVLLCQNLASLNNFSPLFKNLAPFLAFFSRSFAVKEECLLCMDTGGLVSTLPMSHFLLEFLLSKPEAFFFRDCPNQEIGRPFLFKVHATIGTD